MILYNCKQALDDGHYVVTKFDDDMNIESSYVTSLSECECPAGVRQSCRHRQMLPHFIGEDKINTDWFFCFDDQTWHKPFGELDEVEGNAPSIDHRCSCVSMDECDERKGCQVIALHGAKPVGPSPTGTSTGTFHPRQAAQSLDGFLEAGAVRLLGPEDVASINALGGEASVALPSPPAGEGGPAVVPSPAPFRRRV